jgi:PAS domain S-box-containing protein
MPGQPPKRTERALLNVMEDLAMEKAKDEAILASIGEGVIVTDEEGKVTVMNRTAEELLGYKSTEFLGKKLSKALNLYDRNDAVVPFPERPLQTTLTTGKSSSPTAATTYLYARKDGTKFPVAIMVTPVIFNKEIVGTIEVFRDITREQAIDKAKTEFVSLASHQLRTPLGIVKWYLEALANEEYLKKAPAAIQNYLGEIYKSNERVLCLMRNLLSVSRIEQGRVKNEPKMVDIKKLVTEIVGQMQIIAQKRQVVLALTVPDQKIPGINIDELRLHEVVENLVVNAIEYTQPAGTVGVMVRREDDTLLIGVKDTGIGISAADQKNLFTKFFRSEKAVGQNPEGSGLGLYLVKSYVEGWGGKVTVESSEGEGSTFTVSLPIQQK